MVKTFKVRDACSVHGTVHKVTTVNFDHGDEDLSSAELRFAIARKDGSEEKPTLVEVALKAAKEESESLEKFSTQRVDGRKPNVNVVAEIQGVKLFAVRWDSDKKALICRRTPYQQAPVQQPPPLQQPPPPQLPPQLPPSEMLQHGQYKVS